MRKESRARQKSYDPTVVEKLGLGRNLASRYQNTG